MSDLWEDAQFGVRMLQKNPEFTASAVLTLVAVAACCVPATRPAKLSL